MGLPTTFVFDFQDRRLLIVNSHRHFRCSKSLYMVNDSWTDSIPDGLNAGSMTKVRGITLPSGSTCTRRIFAPSASISTMSLPSWMRTCRDEASRGIQDRTNAPKMPSTAMGRSNSAHFSIVIEAFLLCGLKPVQPAAIRNTRQSTGPRVLLTYRANGLTNHLNSVTTPGLEERLL